MGLPLQLTHRWFARPALQHPSTPLRADNLQKHALRNCTCATGWMGEGTRTEIACRYKSTSALSNKVFGLATHNNGHCERTHTLAGPDWHTRSRCAHLRLNKRRHIDINRRYLWDPPQNHQRYLWKLESTSESSTHIRTHKHHSHSHPGPLYTVYIAFSSRLPVPARHHLISLCPLSRAPS